MDEEHALNAVRSAFTPYAAGASMSPLRTITFRVVDKTGRGVLAPSVIQEETWRDPDALRNLLVSLREMLATHQGCTFDSWEMP